MDRARAIFLANEREREAKKVHGKKVTGAATRPVITELQRREAAARAKAQDAQLPPRDRE